MCTLCNQLVRKTICVTTDTYHMQNMLTKLSYIYVYIYIYTYTGPDIPLDVTCKLVVTASASNIKREHTTSGNTLEQWHNHYQNMLINKQQQQHNSNNNNGKVVSPSRFTASEHNKKSHDANYYSDNSDVNTNCTGALQLLIAIKWTEPCCNGSRINSYQIQR
jgi:hypothetical protein